jgi:hypothetical protein
LIKVTPVEGTLLQTYFFATRCHIGLMAIPPFDETTQTIAKIDFGPEANLVFRTLWAPDPIFDQCCLAARGVVDRLGTAGQFHH